MAFFFVRLVHDLLLKRTPFFMIVSCRCWFLHWHLSFAKNLHARTEIPVRTSSRCPVMIPVGAGENGLEASWKAWWGAAALATGSWKSVVPCHSRAKCFTNSTHLLLSPWIATEVTETMVSIDLLTLRHRMWRLLHSLCAVNQQANKLLPVNPNTVIKPAAQKQRGMS